MLEFIRYIDIIKRKPSVIYPALRAFLKTNLLNKKILRGVDIAVTYRCQGKCKKCSCQNLIENGRPEMSKEEIINISKQIISVGGILVNLTGGELLLRPDIKDIIFSLDKMPVIISISTNAVLLDEKLLRDLKQSGLHVLQLNLSSPYPEEHDAEMGIVGSYKNVISAMRIAKEIGISVLLNTVITKEIIYSYRIKALVGLARENNAYLSLVLPAAVGRWKGNYDSVLNREDYNLLKSWLRLKFVTIDTKTCYKKGACPAGTEKIYVSPYGDVYPCPFIHLKMGNLLKDTLSQLKQNIAGRQNFTNCINIK
ncbi:MAG: radical SAM protein [Candidatus Omnitrophica bacterium]|nr:radical SAM protein [Candidatus Omnitrophota bacterium]MDD5518168.1 radical SAM protein [Candidatus Omnitrophota bacterium]